MKTEMNQLENTGERYIPWDSDVFTHYEHLHRYRFAKAFVSGGKVLDLGCGEGYGSHMLSESAAGVTGLDINPVCVAHASDKYGTGIKFMAGSMTDIPIPGAHVFDVVVCFEALEHITDHAAMLAEVKRLLTPDGIFIVSTPDKYEYSDREAYENPFHARELYKEEFIAFLSGGFRHVLLYGQNVRCGSGIHPAFETDSEDEIFFVGRNGNAFAFEQAGGSKAKYHIAIASNRMPDKAELPGNTFLSDNSDMLLNELKACHEGNRLLQEERERMISENVGKLREKDASILRLEERYRDLEAERREIMRERDMMKGSKAWRLAEFLRRLVYRKMAG